MTFEEWLSAHGYRETTATQTLRAIRTLTVSSVDDLERALSSVKSRTALRRYSTFLQETKDSPKLLANSSFDRNVLTLKLTPVNLVQKKVSKFQTVRFDDAEWRKLKKRLDVENQHPEAIVIAVMMVGGYRIGDVLRLERAVLQKGLKTGLLELEVKGGRKTTVAIEGAKEAWELLNKHWKGGRNIAEWVCPKGGGDASTDGGAYKRVQRFLKGVTKELGIAGRANTHRIRHTIAQQALEITEDIHAVQQLLGHKNLSTTERYTKGVRVDAITKIQKQLREKHE